MTGTETSAGKRPRRVEVSREALPLGLLLITLLALLLRLYRLGAPSLWVDEMITLWQGTELAESERRQFLDDPQTPLPTVIVAWVSHVSQAEAWLRLPGALLGSLTPALLYVVGRRVAGERAALFGALLLAVHPLHIYHSQEIRGYAYLLFFGLGAMALMVAPGGRPSWGRVLGIALLGTAAALSNLQGLFWMAGGALGMVIARRVAWRDLPRWGVAFGLVLALTSPWWSASIRMHASERLLPGEDTGEALRGATTFSTWSVPYAGFVLAVGPTLGPSARELHESALDNERQTPSLPQRHLPVVILASALTLALSARGLVRLRGRSLEILAWAAVPLAFALLLAIRNVKPFNPRYVLAALPSLLLVLGAAFDALPRRRAGLLLTGWLVLAGLGLQRSYFDPQYAHEDVRGAARLIRSRESTDDLVLAPTVYRVFEHYYRAFDGRNPVYNYSGLAQAGEDRVWSAVEALDPERRYLWYVRSRPWHDDPRGTLLSLLDERYHSTALFRLPGVEIRLYDRSPPVETPERGLD